MLTIARCRVVCVASVVFLFGAVCGSVGAGVSKELVSQELLEHANLKILWTNSLPMREKENLEKLYILGDRLYALSDHNYMVSMDRENGNVMFSSLIAPVGLPIVGLALYKDELFSIVGNKLVEMNPDFGTKRGAKRLKFGISCPAARNSSYFYVAGTDKRMHVFRAEDMVQVFDVASESDSMITSIVAGEDSIVFSTEAGEVISIEPDKPKHLWTFNAAGAVVGPVVADGQWLFFASEDTYVYVINRSTGRLRWKYQTAGVLDEAPRVTEKVVYQYVYGKGVTAINKDSGKRIWELPGGADLLAEANRNAYVITDRCTLVVMDDVKAKQLYSVNFAGVSRYTSNVKDSKIYIADKGGRIACLEPSE